MAISLEDLPAIDGLTHLTLDDFAFKLGIDIKAPAWEGLTKGQKYNTLVLELTPEDDPLNEETPAAEEAIEKVLTGAIPVQNVLSAVLGDKFNEGFVLHLIDNGTKYELRRLSGIDDRFIFTADEYDRIKALFA